MMTNHSTFISSLRTFLVRVHQCPRTSTAKPWQSDQQ